MRPRGPEQPLTLGVYETAVDVARILADGRCVSTAELSDLLGVRRGHLVKAIDYLRARGADIEDNRIYRCRYLHLRNKIDWRTLTGEQMEHLAIVPEEESTLYDVAVRSSPSIEARLRRAKNPVRQLRLRLMKMSA